MTLRQWKEFSMHDKSAVVTGAARGIGKAIAYRLAGLGARTIIWDRDQAEVEASAQELRELLVSQGRPHNVDWNAVDVSDHELVNSTMNLVAQGGLDILVNSAAINPGEAIENVSLETWEKTIGINLSGVFYCCQAAVPYLQQSPSAAIVNISSSTAITGGVGVNYAASKAGIDGLTRHLAVELAPAIRVNAIQPRSVNSDGFRKYMDRTQDNPSLVIDQITSKIPLGRLGEPIDIADLTAFLASDWARFITGQIILVDGGRTFQ